MTPDVAKRVIEGALLCANRPLAINDIRQLFDEESEVSSDTVQALLDELRQDWQGRSVELVPLASGWRFQCAADIARHVLRLQPERTPRYSRAVMETLAIIAYHQPVTRGDIEEIRGVGVSAHIIKTLEDRGWIDQVGVKEVPGRPALFATTRQFLDDLNLRSLKELPQLDDGLPKRDLPELTGEVPAATVEIAAAAIEAAQAPGLEPGVDAEDEGERVAATGSPAGEAGEYVLVDGPAMPDQAAVDGAWGNADGTGARAEAVPAPEEVEGEPAGHAVVAGAAEAADADGEVVGQVESAAVEDDGR